LTSLEKTVQKLVLIKELATAILLNNDRVKHVYDLVCGESCVAVKALSSASDAVVFFDRACVENLAFGGRTNGTLHK